MPHVTCAILGGGRGTRLFPLTKERCKPAVPLAGQYRLIDIPISNCLNSGYGRIFVITQFNTESLHRHVSRSYPFDTISRRSVEILAAQQTTETQDWYQGTADAVRRNLRHLRLASASHALILSGDHLYRMDYRPMIAEHDAGRADTTIACQPVTAKQAQSLGVLQVDEDGQVTAFAEKPGESSRLSEFALSEPAGTDPTTGDPLTHLASMGVYLFSPGALYELLTRTDFEDFGRELIPWAIERYRVMTHLFRGYWEDIGTVLAYYRANLALTDPLPRFNLHDPEWPIYTRGRHLPPPKINGAELRRALVTEGSMIESGRIERSIIGLRSMIGADCDIRESVLCGWDYYPPPGSVGAVGTASNGATLGIGRDCRVSGAILDKNVSLGDGVRIRGRPGEQISREGQGYHIRDGVVVIPRGEQIAPGTEIVA